MPTSGGRTPFVSSTRRTERLVPVNITRMPLRAAGAAIDPITCAAVESSSGTSVKSSTSTFGRSAMPSSVAPTVAAAPKKNAPEMR